MEWRLHKTESLARGEQATYTSFSDPHGFPLWREGRVRPVQDGGSGCPGGLSPQWGPEVLSGQQHRGLAERSKVEEHPSRDTPHNLVLRARDPPPPP